MTLPNPTSSSALVFLMLHLTPTGRLKAIYNGVDIVEDEQKILKKLYNQGDCILNEKVNTLQVAGKHASVACVGVMHDEDFYHVILSYDEYKSLNERIKNESAAIKQG